MSIDELCKHAVRWPRHFSITAAMVVMHVYGLCYGECADKKVGFSVQFDGLARECWLGYPGQTNG